MCIIRKFLMLLLLGVVRPPCWAIDSDQDLIPDHEEVMRYGTNPERADSDADGMIDGDELIADTDPLNPASILKFYSIQDINLSGAKKAVELLFESSANRKYTLYHTTNLVASAWTPVLADIEGNGEMISLVREMVGVESSGNYLLSTFAGSSGLLTREVWNSPAEGLASLDEGSGSPDLVETVSSFGVPTDAGEQYDQRISGYLVPPVSGSYTFWIAADSSAQLWISADGDPARMIEVASLSTPAAPLEWDKYASQQSAPVYLEAGQSCYVEVLHHADSADSHLAVAWETKGMSRRVVTSSYCRHKKPLPPTAVSDFYSIGEDSTLTVTAYGVLLNDKDPDEQTILEAILETGVQHGTLTLNRDGGFIYTPDSDFFGTDHFTYTAYDGIYSSSNAAVVTFQVNARFDATLTAKNDFYAAPFGDRCEISAPGVLMNDLDPDALGMHAELVADVAHGTLLLNENGSFNYTADAGFEGVDEFSYRAVYGGVKSAAATVKLDMGVLGASDIKTYMMKCSDDNVSLVPDTGSSVQLQNSDGLRSLGLWNAGTPDPVHEGPQWRDVYVPAGFYKAAAYVNGGAGGTVRFVQDGIAQPALALTGSNDERGYGYQTVCKLLEVPTSGNHTFKVEPVTFAGEYLCNLVECSLFPAEQYRLWAKDVELVGNVQLRTSANPMNIWRWNAWDAFPRWDSSDENIDISFPEGAYDCYVEVAWPSNTREFKLVVDGVEYPAQTLAPTGGWGGGDYKLQLLATGVSLNGHHTIEVKSTQTSGSVFADLRQCIFVKPDQEIETDVISVAEIDRAGFVRGDYAMQSDAAAEAWIQAMVRGYATYFSSTATFGRKMWNIFPLYADWFMQDNQAYAGYGQEAGFDARGDLKSYVDKSRDNSLEKKLIAHVGVELGRRVDPALNYPAGDARWLELYVELCKTRRQKRLEKLRAKTDTVIYAARQNRQAIYLEAEPGCLQGSQLREIDLTPLDLGQPVVDSLVFDSGDDGVVRDPEISFDGKKMLFAYRTSRGACTKWGRIWGKSGHYKIYEMTLADRSIRQLTHDESDPDHAGTYGPDMEPCYLPNGDIMFSSARIVTEVTCGWGDSVNMYIMDKDGNYARRVGFDQTQTAFPHLLKDGRVVYTRRDYNDRGQTFAHALFVMNPDGTMQTEYYKNNSCEPTSLQHTRAIPGTGMTMSIAGGYHTNQGGKLCRINPKKGRQAYEGIEFYNWDWKNKKRGDDLYGREGEQFCNPYPMGKEDFLVSFEPLGGYISHADGRFEKGDETSGEYPKFRYKLYYMTWDGTRELLTHNKRFSCLQGVPVAARPVPPQRLSMVNYTKDFSTMYVENVYYGPSAEGIEPGTIKKIRVGQLYYKPVTIGGARWAPPRSQVGPGKRYSSLGQHSVLPVGVATASFDAKGILGEVDVHPDGSAFFKVPPRTPIFLQLIDENNEAVQVMRSWATLQPFEFFSCVGCHEENDQAPLNKEMTQAMTMKPQELAPFASRPQDESFSYARLIQPIWDAHCMPCHAPGGTAADFDLSNTIVRDKADDNFSSTMRQFYQSYLTLLDAKKGADENSIITPGMTNRWVNYATRLLTVELTPPYDFGSTQSELIDLIRTDHYGIHLSEDEIALVCAWIDLNVPFIGDYDEMNIWSDGRKNLYRNKLNKRHQMESIEQENIQAFIDAGQPK